MYNTQNYWVSGLYLSSGVLKTRKHRLLRRDLFPFSGEGEDAFSVGSRRKSQLKLLEERQIDLS
jgi:hypothetical protein